MLGKPYCGSMSHARSADPDYNLLTRAIGITTPARFNHLDARGWYDFPAHGYPLDDDAPAYELSVERPQFEPVPLKYGFYLLAQELDKTAMQTSDCEGPCLLQLLRVSGKTILWSRSFDQKHARKNGRRVAQILGPGFSRQYCQPTEGRNLCHFA